MRQLIINADDLGLTSGVNLAIVQSHLQGVVTSATLMANGRAFEDAVSRLKLAPRLSVGCHVVLVDGIPVCDPGSIGTIVNHRALEARSFHPRLSSVAARAVFGGFDPDDLIREITAQVEKIQAAGVRVTHLDTHKHTHVFPSILRAVLKVARICGVPAIRNPFVRGESVAIQTFRHQRESWKRMSQVRLLRAYAGQFREQVRKAGLATPDGAVGIVETGSLTLSGVCDALRDLPDGTWELVCHPGYVDNDLQQVQTKLRNSREQERQILVSEEFREFLQKEKISLVSYRELGEQHDVGH